MIFILLAIAAIADPEVVLRNPVNTSAAARTGHGSCTATRLFQEPGADAGQRFPKAHLPTEERRRCRSRLNLGPQTHRLPHHHSASCETSGPSSTDTAPPHRNSEPGEARSLPAERIAAGRYRR